MIPLYPEPQICIRRDHPAGQESPGHQTRCCETNTTGDAVFEHTGTADAGHTTTATRGQQVGHNIIQTHNHNHNHHQYSLYTIPSTSSRYTCSSPTTHPFHPFPLFLSLVSSSPPSSPPLCSISPWNIGAAYRVPDSNINLSCR